MFPSPRVKIYLPCTKSRFCTLIGMQNTSVLLSVWMLTFVVQLPTRQMTEYLSALPSYTLSDHFSVVSNTRGCYNR